jgi:ATP-dependent exoDNAse (exonuclease V) beta subunit
MQLLLAGRSVQVAGSDIGPKLIGILKKLGPPDLTRTSVLSAIADWEAEKVDKGSTTAGDLAECMRVFASHGQSLAAAISYAEHLFAQKGTIRLMTGHKAKGLEFETVYHLDPWLCKDDEQDQNLRYVIQTRSMDKLYEINSRDIRWA